MAQAGLTLIAVTTGSKWLTIRYMMRLLIVVVLIFISIVVVIRLMLVAVNIAGGRFGAG